MALDRGDDGFECRQFFVRPFWRRVACWTSTLPATVVMARTRTSGERSAMIKATASSEAVSVSIRKRGFTRRRIAKSARRRAQNNLGLGEIEFGERATNERGAHHFENRRTLRDIGSPTQKICMTTPIIINFMENGRLAAAESGSTMRFMKK